jgi:hypothetical protein
MKKVRFLGLDVHAETLAAALLEALEACLLEALRPNFLDRAPG